MIIMDAVNGVMIARPVVAGDAEAAHPTAKMGLAAAASLAEGVAGCSAMAI